VFATLPPVEDVPEEALAARTRATYKGPLVIGRDLMSFVISDKVEAFAPDGQQLTPQVSAQ
jgi:ribonuclease Z